MGLPGLRRIAVLVYPHVDLLDVAGPSEVFAATRQALAAVGGTRNRATRSRSSLPRRSLLSRRTVGSGCLPTAVTTEFVARSIRCSWRADRDTKRRRRIEHCSAG